MKRSLLNLAASLVIASILLSACQLGGSNVPQPIADAAGTVTAIVQTKVVETQSAEANATANAMYTAAANYGLYTETPSPTIMPYQTQVPSATATNIPLLPTNTATMTLDDNVVIAFFGKLRNNEDSSSGHEGIMALHKSWLQIDGGYGLQGDVIALFCGHNGVNIAADDPCRIKADEFVRQWNIPTGLKYEFGNDAFQYMKIGDRLYYFAWDTQVPANQISNIYWTGSSLVICMNDSGPTGKFGGSDVGPCIETANWVPWDQAEAAPGFAPYFQAYLLLESIPTATDLLAHGNPILLETFTKAK